MIKYGVIYLVINKINNKVYVGQTKNSFDERYPQGLFKSTHNKGLKEDIIMYGMINFIIIKELDIAYSKKELLKKEMEYIKKFDALSSEKGYNEMFNHSVIDKIIPNATPVLLLDIKTLEPVMYYWSKGEAIHKLGTGLYNNYKMVGYRDYFKMDICRYATHELHSKLFDTIGAEYYDFPKVIMIDKRTQTPLKIFNTSNDICMFLNKSKPMPLIQRCLEGAVTSAYGYVWVNYYDFIVEHPDFNIDEVTERVA